MRVTAPARSDQINADDFIGGPRTFTLGEVHPGKAEQLYDIDLVELPGKVWRPPLTVLRLLIAAWGDEASDWAGRRVTLFRDESVSFGKDAIGGIRISHMSHLPDEKPFKTKVQTSRGKRTPMSVEPLIEEATTPEPTAEQVAECNDVDALRAMWKNAGPERQAQIKARVDELNAEAGE